MRNSGSEPDPSGGDEQQHVLAVNPETVSRLILLAKDFGAYEEMTMSEDLVSPSDDRALQMLAARSDDPVLLEIESLVSDLEPDQQVELVALTWLGRGDFEAEEWEQALKAAGDAWNERTAAYLMGTPLVADYLTEGLYRLGYTVDES